MLCSVLEGRAVLHSGHFCDSCRKLQLHAPAVKTVATQDNRRKSDSDEEGKPVLYQGHRFKSLCKAFCIQHILGALCNIFVCSDEIFLLIQEVAAPVAIFQPPVDASAAEGCAGGILWTLRLPVSCLYDSTIG